jgi:hypothetical protein
MQSLATSDAGKSQIAGQRVLRNHSLRIERRNPASTTNTCWTGYTDTY